MAKIQKPNRKNSKGTPPPETLPSQNLTKSDPKDSKPLNFRVPADFKKEFKQLALDLDISMVDLLRISFAKYKESVK